jgi:hypothetical protein
LDAIHVGELFVEFSIGNMNKTHYKTRMQAISMELLAYLRNERVLTIVLRYTIC